MANSEPKPSRLRQTLGSSGWAVVSVSLRRSEWGNSLRCFHRRRMQRKLKFQRTAVCAVVIMIATCRGLALDPGQPASSYLRKNFTIEDGLPTNEVYAILQTQNGFLLVGTDAGLARFDGQRFTPINIGIGVAQQIPVRSLLTTPEGDLWVGTDAGLARIPSAALDHFDRALVTMYHVGVGQSDQILCVAPEPRRHVVGNQRRTVPIRSG